MEEVGECDTCGSTYDLASRWNRCGECGDCGNCCQHSEEWEAVGVYQDDRLVCLPCSGGEGERASAEALPDGFTCDECGVVVNV